jgi:hypothetical protein
MTVSETQPPPPSKHGDTWERGLDPWHEDAFKGIANLPDIGTKGERRKGWHAVDWCGNCVGWIPDGTVIDEQQEEPPMT